MAMRWRVIGQRQFDQLTDTGTFRSVVEVTYQLASGTTGRLTIPSNLYTAEYVSNAVEAAAQTLLAVEELQG